MTKDWVHGVGHSPVLLQIVVRAVIASFPPAWTSSARMLMRLKLMIAAAHSYNQPNETHTFIFAFMFFFFFWIPRLVICSDFENNRRNI